MNENKYQSEDCLYGCQDNDILTTSAQNYTDCCQNPEVNTAEGMCIENEVGTDVQPRSSFTVTLHGNGGFINGAAVTTRTMWQPTPIGHLPLVDSPQQARFLGWSLSPTGTVIHPQLMIEGNMTLYARLNTANYNQMTRSELAQEILHRINGVSTTGRRISYNQLSGMHNGSGLSPRDNLRDTAAGRQATRAPHSGGTNPVVIGGSVFLQENLLRAILRMNDQFGTVTINSLAGGRHSPTSWHYEGRAVDFQSTDSRVNGINLVPMPTVTDFLRNTWGFNTTGSYYVHNFFHLEIRN